MMTNTLIVVLGVLRDVLPDDPLKLRILNTLASPKYIGRSDTRKIIDEMIAEIQDPAGEVGTEDMVTEEQRGFNE